MGVIRKATRTDPFAVKVLTSSASSGQSTSHPSRSQRLARSAIPAGLRLGAASVRRSITPLDSTVPNGTLTMAAGRPFSSVDTTSAATIVPSTARATPRSEQNLRPRRLISSQVICQAENCLSTRWTSPCR